ncbi:MAG: TlpA family protein disulfide reductase [Betaproteobacteria bacterium]|nr:TlpA family protein disulfide reductase [Betaproteobacteria bacterium]
MPTITLGHMALPANLLAPLAGLLIAAGLGGLIGRREKISIISAMIDMLLAALVAARMVFVIQWFDSYRSAPWSMLDIRDGGFSPWAGLAAALLVAAWQGWRRADLRKPLLLGLTAGALVWAGGLAVLRLLVSTSHTVIPAVALTTLSGAPVMLPALAEGKPMVVNLWASWCPPCRREMPVLAAAQHREAGIRFVFVNQGESTANAASYLSAAQFDLANVLLDPGTRLGHELGAMALPTTLFYDAGGRLVDSHMGPLSTATLAEKLTSLQTNNHPTTKE